MRVSPSLSLSTLVSYNLTPSLPRSCCSASYCNEAVPWRPEDTVPPPAGPAPRPRPAPAVILSLCLSLSLWSLSCKF